MRLRGGYNVRLTGKPTRTVETLPDPEVLHVPLWSRRFRFTHLLVEEGQHVITGQPLAKDPANYSMSLIAPRGGIVRLEKVANHITLEDIEKEPEKAGGPGPQMSEGMSRYKIFALGAWRFVRDIHTGSLPDPFGMPKELIVSAVHLEPYVARGDAQLRGRLPEFISGLKHLSSLLRVRQLHVVIPKERSAFATELREALRKQSDVRTFEIRCKYPHDDLRLVARALGMRKRSGSAVWGMGVAGVLAIEEAMRSSRPCVGNVVSVGGPGAREPKHVRAILGYPIKDIVDRYASQSPCRVINGGALTGTALDASQAGLDLECEGLTILPEHDERELFAFTRPGWSRRSYGRVFFSSLRPPFSERLNTALRGEKRACVSCGFCEEVCPAGIMPYLIHKYLYEDNIEEAEKARLDLCVECGLCSFVCPSKIELSTQIADAKEGIRRELETEEATA
ncbi:MAG: 4Fe-4S dicluster domain-containing protein [Planctomycetota bacterium]|jgi:Na+-transporting NADH:ubiquinone oxidoreductase subunit A